MSQSPLSPPAIVMIALRFVAGHLPALLRLALLPSVLYLLLDVMVYHWRMELPIAVFLIANVVIAASYSILAHRYYLLGPAYVSKFGFGRTEVADPRIDAGFGRFVSRALLYTLFLILALLPIGVVVAAAKGSGGAMASLIGIAALLALSPLLVRPLPLFPAIAGGAIDFSIADALRISAGHGVRHAMVMILAFVALLPLAVPIAMLIMTLMAGEAPGIVAIIGASLSGSLMAALSGALYAAANAEVYLRLGGRIPLARDAR